jgi:1-deoxyxylulose-5-phosphate synthase
MSLESSLDVSRPIVTLFMLLGQDGIMAPLIGATRAQHIDDAAAALAVRLSGAEQARLEAGYQARLLSDY